MVQLSYFRYESNLIDHMQLCINCIYTAVYALEEDINALYEYMRALSTQQLNPLSHLIYFVTSWNRLKMAFDLMLG